MIFDSSSESERVQARCQVELRQYDFTPRYGLGSQRYQIPGITVQIDKGAEVL